MITKNEAKNIQRCLDSVKGLVNEILVMDTGSTDNTVEIIKENFGNIIKFDLDKFDFATARNKVLRSTIGKWILHLDADEELLPESREFIERVIQTDERIGYNCQVRCIMPDKEIVSIPSIRLFKNEPGIRYTGKAHEQIFPSLHRLGYEIKECEVSILHHGYDTSNKRIKEKLIRNLQLLLGEFNRSKRSHTALQISETYSALGWDGSADKYMRLSSIGMGQS